MHPTAEYLYRLLRGEALPAAEAEALMTRIMAGEFTTAQIAALAVALRAKGETEEEITGFARAMRAGAMHLPDPPEDVLDTCGTGGDGLATFNVSTTAALIAAGAGARVAKHGNRAASSRAGSADVLEALGVKLELPPAAAARVLREVGIVFLFARAYHPAMRHAAAARAEIGIRTIFNLLGPLTNPAGARRQLMGVFPGVPTARMAGVLRALGAQHAMVVRGDDGMDEISLCAPTEVSELRDGAIATYHVTPEQFGFARCEPAALHGGDAQDNARLVRAVLDGEQSPRADIAIFNAGAALYVAGRAPAWQDGIALARQAVASGAARATLEHLIQASNASYGR